MKLTVRRAIEVLERFCSPSARTTPEETSAALELGIEALKRVESNRRGGYTAVYQLLPSEASDEEEEESE